MLTGRLVATEVSNSGRIEIETTEQLDVTQLLTNSGLIELDGGVITSTFGSMVNLPGGIIRGGSAVTARLRNSGLIHANSSSMLILVQFEENDASGELRIDDGSSASVTGESVFWFNSGAVVLRGEDATLSGDDIFNSGTIRGAGRISNTVDNQGVVRGEGGVLSLAVWARTRTVRPVASRRPPAEPSSMARDSPGTAERSRCPAGRSTTTTRR